MEEKIVVRQASPQKSVPQKSVTTTEITPTQEKAIKSKRIAMTLRMENEDHLKLRLYAAHSRKSCQEIISEALEMYLSEDEKVCGLSDCNCLNN